MRCKAHGRVSCTGYRCKQVREENRDASDAGLTVLPDPFVVPVLGTEYSTTEGDTEECIPDTSCWG